MGLVRIAVVSRDRLYCEGLCQILRRDPTLHVVAVDEEHDSKAATGVDIRVVDVSGGVPLTGVASDGQGPHVIAVGSTGPSGTTAPWPSVSATARTSAH